MADNNNEYNIEEDQCYNESLEFFSTLTHRLTGPDWDFAKAAVTKYERGECTMAELREKLEFVCETQEESNLLDAWLPDVDENEEAEEEAYNKEMTNKAEEEKVDVDEVMKALRAATRKRKQCSVGRCTNIAQKGGVCCRHGAKRKQCSVGRCTSIAKKGGVCWRHGAKINHKRCSKRGCTSNARVGGVCRRHGARS